MNIRIHCNSKGNQEKELTGIQKNKEKGNQNCTVEKLN
jgi:hypothetical protein